MSQEKVREILSHVDMTKIDLSSFQLSSKKFDELATLYRNRLILTCVAMIAENDSGKSNAYDVLERIADNPDIYFYDAVYAYERNAVDEAINDITYRRDRSINGVKVKAIQNRIKATYKEMRKSIEGALENGATFNEEFNEETVNRCLQIARSAIANGRQQALKAHQEPEKQEPVVEETPQVVVEQPAEETAQVETMTVEEHPTEPKKPEKVSFWKKIFGKMKA
jgi:hypothetical protein